MSHVTTGVLLGEHSSASWEAIPDNSGTRGKPDEVAIPGLWAARGTRTSNRLLCPIELSDFWVPAKRNNRDYCENSDLPRNIASCAHSRVVWILK
jgi:hypothetical protein